MKRRNRERSPGLSPTKWLKSQMPDTPPIFINYRRTKTRDKALILRWILEKEFGGGVSFLDRESIPPGTPSRDELRQAVEQCDVLLALIHADWHKDQDPESGEKSLNNPQDWIRQEIATALQAGKRVIPLLIDQAYMYPEGVDDERTNPPKKEWLPADLHDLFENQLFQLRFNNLTPEKLAGFLGELSASDGNRLIILDQVEEVLTNPIFNLPEEIASLKKDLVIALDEDPRLSSSWRFAEYAASLKHELNQQVERLRYDSDNTVHPLERQSFVEAIRSVSVDRSLNGPEPDRPYYLHFWPPDLPQTIAERLIAGKAGPHIAPLLQVNMEAVAYCNWLSAQMGWTPAYAIDRDQPVPRNLDETDKTKWTVRIIERATGFRLPTEAEWEYACRAGTTTDYSFDDDVAALGEYAWFADNSGSSTQPMAKKQPEPVGVARRTRECLGVVPGLVRRRLL